MMHDAPTRPIMRYHGGKWRLAPWIIYQFPPHRVYVEPFGGAASVLLRKERSYAEIYNDLDGEVVNVFRQARDNGQVLRDALYYTPFSRDEFELSYEPCEDGIEQARRTIVRSFMGFGSSGISGRATGFRANSNRDHTTPAHDWRNYAEVFDCFIARLRGVVTENTDAMATMAAHDSADTLHYVDPPYLGETRSDLTHRYRHELSAANHKDLADFLKRLEGTVILSGYPSSDYDTLFSYWTRIDRDALADGAQPRTECLWINRLDNAGRLL